MKFLKKLMWWYLGFNALCIVLSVIGWFLSQGYSVYINKLISFTIDLTSNTFSLVIIFALLYFVIGLIVGLGMLVKFTYRKIKAGKLDSKTNN